MSPLSEMVAAVAVIYVIAVMVVQWLREHWAAILAVLLVLAGAGLGIVLIAAALREWLARRRVACWSRATPVIDGVLESAGSAVDWRDSGSAALPAEAIGGLHSQIRSLGIGLRRADLNHLLGLRVEELRTRKFVDWLREVDPALPMAPDPSRLSEQVDAWVRRFAKAFPPRDGRSRTYVRYLIAAVQKTLGARLSPEEIAKRLNEVHGQNALRAYQSGAARPATRPTFRSVSIADVDAMSDRDFEILVGLLWRAQGFATEVTSRGISDCDVIACAPGVVYVIDAKHRKQGAVVATAEVLKVSGYMKKHGTGGALVFGVLVTNRSFAAPAWSAASYGGDIELVERCRLNQLLCRYPVSLDSLRSQ